MRVKVETQYQPGLTERHLRRALKWVNPLDLAGVEFIRLRTEKKPSEGSSEPDFIKGDVCFAQYVRPNPRARNAEPTHIDIFTRPFYYGIPSVFKHTPVATLRVAFAVGHELGHHLVRRRGYVYEPTEKYKPYGVRDEREELAANRYAIELVRSMRTRWYYSAGHWLAGMLSRRYYDLGLVAWDKRDYHRAAYYCFCSFCDDSENNDARRMYRQAVARVRHAASEAAAGAGRSRVGRVPAHTP